MNTKNYRSSQSFLLISLTVILIYGFNTINPQRTDAAESSQLIFNSKSLEFINRFDRFYDVSSVKEQIFISGHFGAVLRSIDSGETWERLKTPTNKPLLGIESINEKIVWAVGGDGAVIHTKDGGETWTLIEIGTTEQLFQVEFINEQKGWIVGAYGTLLYTSDGGKNWEDHGEKVVLPYDEFEAEIHPMLNDIYFVDELTGWLVGENGTVFNTIDGGENWSYEKIIVEQRIPYLKAVFFQSPEKGVIIGEQGILLQTNNGGEDWRFTTLNTDYSLFDVSGDSNGYIIVGDNGLGISLEPNEAGLNQKYLFRENGKYGWISGVDISPSGRIVACGTNGSIMVSHGSNIEWTIFGPIN
ncbi:MAG: YCF48-related protein [Desulfobacterales bacterium]|jgi:photosystem II stability/assembly factor-like uncharacterized protein|nr:YCF48-related protein [Desulfobacterales bacterium]